MPTAYIYVRVSTTEQHLSPEWQEGVCKNYYHNGSEGRVSLKDRGFDLHPEVFADIGQSAYSIALAERPAGRSMFQMLKRGDIIIAAKQDRLWRTVRDKENSMFFFRQIGVDMAILDTGIDTTTAAGKFAAGVVALQSQWESDVRSERAKAANIVRRKRRKPGHHFSPPGWRFDKEKEELVPDIRERKLLEMIYRWRIGRVRSIQSTCKWLTEKGVRRHNGCKYDACWVVRAHLCYVQGWPAVGYIQATWKGKGIPAEEREKGRLPLPEGRQAIWKYQGQRGNSVDLRWLAQEFGVSLGESGQPDESRASQSLPSA